MLYFSPKYMILSSSRTRREFFKEGIVHLIQECPVNGSLKIKIKPTCIFFHFVNFTLCIHTMYEKLLFPFAFQVLALSSVEKFYIFYKECWNFFSPKKSALFSHLFCFVHLRIKHSNLHCDPDSIRAIFKKVKEIYDPRRKKKKNEARIEFRLK